MVVNHLVLLFCWRCYTYSQDILTILSDQNYLPIILLTWYMMKKVECFISVHESFLKSLKQKYHFFYSLEIAEESQW